MRLEPLIAKKFEMKGSEKSRQSLLDRDMEIKLAENIRALRKQLSLTQEHEWDSTIRNCFDEDFNLFDTIEPFDFSMITEEEFQSQFARDNAIFLANDAKLEHLTRVEEHHDVEFSGIHAEQMPEEFDTAKVGFYDDTPRCLRTKAMCGVSGRRQCFP